MTPRRGIFTLLLCFATATAKPIRVILDTDIGSDFDDSFALALILSRPDVYDVKLVQCSTYNTTIRAQIAAKMLTDMMRLDVPIGVGRYTGEYVYPQYSIAKNYTLEDFAAAGGNYSYGTTAMRNLMASATAADPVYIIEIAPATSLGDVLAVEPHLAANCVAVAMSGSVYKGYGHDGIDAEYNVVRDIAAAQFMYNSTWLIPLVTAPLDTTIFQQWNGAIYASFVLANDTEHAIVSSLMANYQAWYDGGGKNNGALQPFSPSSGTSTLYDAQAAYMTGLYAGWRRSDTAAPPGFPYVSMATLNLIVNGTGFTVVAPEGKTVFAAVGFPHSQQADVTSLGSDVIASIVMAN